MAKKTKNIILTWDWKDDVPLHGINDALEEVSNGRNCPGFHEVNTSSDTVAVVVTTHRISVVEAQEIWEAWQEEHSIKGDKANES